jgi:hypothetical protein
LDGKSALRSQGAARTSKQDCSDSDEREVDIEDPALNITVNGTLVKKINSFMRTQVTFSAKQPRMRGPTTVPKLQTALSIPKHFGLSLRGTISAMSIAARVMIPPPPIPVKTAQ